MQSMLLGILTVVLLLIVEVLTFHVPRPFDCKNSLISDEWREVVLKFHNDHRRKVAEGKQTTKNNKLMKRARKMNELVWDCDLEHNAYLSICDPSTKISGRYAPTDKVTVGSNGKCDIIAETKTALKLWWAESESRDLSEAKNLYNRAIKNFGRMVSGEVKGFGCSYSNCNTKTEKNELLCIYDYRAQPNAQLYSTADSDADICMDCPIAKCESFLCQYEYTGAPFANPQPSCRKDGMTFDMQTIATDMHNHYRRILASGWAKDSNGYAPRAKQLPALEYDCEIIGKKTLELIPCSKAESLNTINPTEGYSLNYHREKYRVSREETLKKAIEAWWGQLEKVDVDEEAMCTDDEIEDSARFFIPMALEKTKKVGCAVNQCKREGYTIAACQYDATPDEDEAMYEVGPPCTGCTKNSQACENVGGQLSALCVANP